MRCTSSCGALQVFNVVPTLLEVTLVAGILAYKCGPSFAILTGATLTAYTAFTFAITSVSWAGRCTCRLLNPPACLPCSLPVGAPALLPVVPVNRHGTVQQGVACKHEACCHCMQGSVYHAQHLSGSPCQS